MMALTRKPFVSMLAVAGVAVALTLALLLATLPPPIRAAVKHCIDARGFCHDLVFAARAAGSPLLLLLTVVQLAWSGWRAAREGWRQWRATRVALDYLAVPGLRAPTGALADLCADLGVVGRVDIVDRGTPVAFCHGVWRPRIRLSTGLLAILGMVELRALLCHERARQRRCDPLRLLVARSCAAAFPHLPVLRELALALPFTQELAADRAVMRDGARDALGRALLALTIAGDGLPVPTLATGMLSCLDARIDQLTGAEVSLPGLSRRAIARTGVVLSGSLLLLTGLLISAPPH